MENTLLKIQTSFLGIQFKDFITSIGGILGFFSFYFQFLRKFKPKISTSNVIYFSANKVDKFKLKENEYVFNKIFLRTGITNSRNSYGSVDDLLLRVYNSSSTKPRAITYHLNMTGEDWDKLNDLTSITVPPKSFVEKIFMFTVDEFTNNILSIDELSGLKVDVYFRTSTESRWKYLKGMTLFPTLNKNICDSPSDTDMRGNHLVLYTFDKEQSRKKAEKSFKGIKPSIYTGWWDHWYEGKRLRFFYYLKWPFRKTTRFVHFTWMNYQRLKSFLLAVAIKERIILNKGHDRLNFSFKNVPNHHSIDEAYSFLQKKLLELIEASNNRSQNKESQIVFKKENDRVIFTGRRSTAIMYVTGNNTIYITHEGRRPKAIEYMLQSKETLGSVRYYELNGKPIFLNVAALELFDSLSLHLK